MWANLTISLAPIMFIPMAMSRRSSNRTVAALWNITFTSLTNVLILSLDNPKSAWLQSPLRALILLSFEESMSLNIYSFEFDNGINTVRSQMSRTNTLCSLNVPEY